MKILILAAAMILAGCVPPPPPGLNDRRSTITNNAARDTYDNNVNRDASGSNASRDAYDCEREAALSSAGSKAQAFDSCMRARIRARNRQ
jgi:hypothetical protein